MNDFSLDRPHMIRCQCWAARWCRSGAAAVALLLLSRQTAPAAEDRMSVRKTVPAAACDHRYGATATWSQGTDTAQKNSFWWAEACAFRSNLAVTVFDIPFRQGSRYVPIPEREAAARTGRLSFQVYVASDSWFDPVKKRVSRIPDYYATAWTQAGVNAGFQVEVGAAKRARFPNHGKQLYECSAGRFGYDTDKENAAKTDVLRGLLEVQTEWVREHFGHPASAGGYRNGQTGAAHGIRPFLLGVRNSSVTGGCSYGNSSMGSGTLGTEQRETLTHCQAVSLPLTTRAGDLERPQGDVLEHCAELLQGAITTHGWYRDFNHWHTSPRFELDLGEYYTAQRAAMGTHHVVTLDFGEALQHKFLRDMASVAARETALGVELTVTYADPYGTLPLSVFHIPLSVTVDLRQTRLATKEIAVDGCPVRKTGPGQAVVDVPFRGREEVITVLLKAVSGADHYLDLSLPSVLSVQRFGPELEVRTDKPVQLVLFAAPKGTGLRKVRVPVRSHRFSATHRLPVDADSDHDFYVGAITATGQSILHGPLASPIP